MSLLLFGTANRIVVGDGPASFETVAAVYRTWETPSDDTARFTLPLAPNNSYTTDDVALFKDGVEVPIYIEELRGRHNDGSGGDGGARAFFVECDATGWTDTDVLEWRLGTTRTTTDLSASGRGASEITQAQMRNPRAVLITDPAYLCASWLTQQPLLPASQQTADETAFFDTLHDDSVETWVDVRWAQYNPVDGTIDPRWNLDATAGYQVTRGYLSKWCRTGETEYWWRGIRHAEASFSGYSANTVPAEQWSMMYFDWPITYAASGYEAMWFICGATTVASGGAAEGEALWSSDEATSKSKHISPSYGIRYNTRQKYAALQAACFDIKRTALSRQPTFATEMPWMIDSFEGTAFTRGDLACLAGLIGMDENATLEDPTAFPIFQISVINAWLMDYYHNVEADARIPGLVKDNLDVLLGQMDDFSGRKGTAYLWGCPKNAATGSQLLPMFAAQAAWVSALYDTVGNTTYADLYSDCINASNVSVANDIQYNATKLYGEVWGWSQSAPYYRANGAAAAPSAIREPATYP